MAHPELTKTKPHRMDERTYRRYETVLFIAGMITIIFILYAGVWADAMPIAVFFAIARFALHHARYGTAGVDDSNE